MLSPGLRLSSSEPDLRLPLAVHIERALQVGGAQCMMHQAERVVVVGARKVTPGGTSKLRLRRRVPTGNLKVRIL